MTQIFELLTKTVNELELQAPAQSCFWTQGWINLIIYVAMWFSDGVLSSKSSINLTDILTLGSCIYSCNYLLQLKNWHRRSNHYTYNTELSPKKKMKCLSSLGSYWPQSTKDICPSKLLSYFSRLNRRSWNQKVDPAGKLNFFPSTSSSFGLNSWCSSLSHHWQRKKKCHIIQTDFALKHNSNFCLFLWCGLLISRG